MTIQEIFDWCAQKGFREPFISIHDDGTPMAFWQRGNWYSSIDFYENHQIWGYSDGVKTETGIFNKGELPAKFMEASRETTIEGMPQSYGD